MTVYALSGVVMIFRDTDFLKQEKLIEKKLAPNLAADSVGRAIRIRDLKFESENGELMIFKTGSYNKATGETKYTVKSLPYVLDKLTKCIRPILNHPYIFSIYSLVFHCSSSFSLHSGCSYPKQPSLRKG